MADSTIHDVTLPPLSPVSPPPAAASPMYTRPTRTIAVVGALSTQGNSLISALLDANVQANTEAKAYREKQRNELDEERGRRGLGPSSEVPASVDKVASLSASSLERLRDAPKPRASSNASTDPAEYLHSGWPVAPPSSQSRLYSPAIVFDDEESTAPEASPAATAAINRPASPPPSTSSLSSTDVSQQPRRDERPLSPPDSADIDDPACIDYLNIKDGSLATEFTNTAMGTEELEITPPWRIRALLRPGEGERDDVFQLRARGVEVCHVDFDKSDEGVDEAAPDADSDANSSVKATSLLQALGGVWGVFVSVLSPNNTWIGTDRIHSIVLRAQAAPPSRDGFACGSNGSGTSSSFGFGIGSGLRNDENLASFTNPSSERNGPLPLPSADATVEALQLERQGKVLVDTAAEAGVTHFVWSCTGDVRRVNDYLARHQTFQIQPASDDTADSVESLSSSDIAPSSSPPPPSSDSGLLLPLPAPYPRSHSQRVTPSTSASSSRPHVGPRSVSDPTATASSSDTPWSDAPPPPLILAHAAVQRHLDDLVAAGRIKGCTTLAVALPFEGFSECAWMSFLKAEGGYYCQMPTPTDAPLPFCSAEDTGACALLAFEDPELYSGLHLDVCSELTSPKELCAQLTQIIYISGKRVLPSPVVLTNDFEESRMTTFRRDEETWQTLRWLLSWGQMKMAQRGRRAHMAREGEGLASASSSPSLDGLSSQTVQVASIDRIVHSRLTPWRTYATIAADDLLPGWRESFTPLAARKKLTQLQAPKRSPLSGDSSIPASGTSDSLVGDDDVDDEAHGVASTSRRASASAGTPRSPLPIETARSAGMPSSLIGAWSNNSPSYAGLAPSRHFPHSYSMHTSTHQPQSQQQQPVSPSQQHSVPPPVPASSALLVSALLTADTSVLPMHADPASLARRVSAYEFDFDMMTAAAKRAQEQELSSGSESAEGTPDRSPSPLPRVQAAGMGGGPPGAMLGPEEAITAVA